MEGKDVTNAFTYTQVITPSKSTFHSLEKVTRKPPHATKTKLLHGFQKSP
jgi:hypothetical protein